MKFGDNGNYVDEYGNMWHDLVYRSNNNNCFSNNPYISSQDKDYIKQGLVDGRDYIHLNYREYSNTKELIANDISGIF